MNFKWDAGARIIGQCRGDRAVERVLRSSSPAQYSEVAEDVENLAESAGPEGNQEHPIDFRPASHRWIRI